MTNLSRAFLLAALCCGGCQPQVVELTEVLNYERCKTVERGARWIEFSELLTIRGASLKQDSEAAHATLSPPPLALLVVSPGDKLSTGFDLKLKQFKAASATLELSFRLTPPTDPAAEEKIVTRPCMVVGINQDAPLKVVNVSLDGRALATLPFPAAPL